MGMLSRVGHRNRSLGYRFDSSFTQLKSCLKHCPTNRASQRRESASARTDRPRPGVAALGVDMAVSADPFMNKTIRAIRRGVKAAMEPVRPQKFQAGGKPVIGSHCRSDGFQWYGLAGASFAGYGLECVQCG